MINFDLVFVKVNVLREGKSFEEVYFFQLPNSVFCRIKFVKRPPMKAEMNILVFCFDLVFESVNDREKASEIDRL